MKKILPALFFFSPLLSHAQITMTDYTRIKDSTMRVVLKYKKKGESFLYKTQSDSAIAYLSNAIENSIGIITSPEHDSINSLLEIDLARTYIQKQDYQNAGMYYDMSTYGAPQNTECNLYYNAGENYFLAKNYDKSIEACNNALIYTNNTIQSSKVLELMGDVYEAEGNHDKAKTYYDESMKLKMK